MEDRLNTILNHFRLSPSQLAAKIGVQRSGVSHILSGRNRPGLDFIIKLLQAFPQIDPDWLLTGKGSLLRLKPGKELTTAEPISLFPEIQTNTTERVETSGFQPKMTTINKQPDKKKPAQEDVPAPVKPKFTQIRADKVLILYSDGSFQEFTQEISGRE